MDNRPLATSSYKEALKLDVYCFEAFDLLTSHHMLTAQEGETKLSTFFVCPLSCFIYFTEFDTLFPFAISERDFLDSLPFSQQCTMEDVELLHFLYENKLKKVNIFRNNLGINISGTPNFIKYCYSS